MTNDERLVQSAETRAAIIGWLSQNPGPHRTNEIAEAVGIAANRAKHALERLEEMEQVEALGGGSRGKVKKYFKGEPGTVQPPRPAPQPVAKARAGGEVELVVAGLTIIVGRNPASGRPRITLEV